MSDDLQRTFKITTDVKQTAIILKEILTIIKAIAFTMAIVIFLTNGKSTPNTFAEYRLESLYAFICVITAIVRFFHGNISYITRTYDVPDYEALARKYNLKLGIDFFFIFTQGVIFSALALYQSNAFEFYSLFALLFLIDSIWFFIQIIFSRKTYLDFETKRHQEHMVAQVNWMVANFITAMIMTVLIMHRPKEQMTTYIPLFFAIIMVNTILDYLLNRRLYFPIGITKAKRASVFIAARFTSAFEGGKFDQDLKGKIDAIHEIIMSLGLNLYSAHQIEKFGEELDNSDKFVKRDIAQISSSDIIVALLEEKLSTGVCVELGWASFMGKKIIIIVPDEFDLHKIPMVRGLVNLTYCDVIRYKDLGSLRNNLRLTLQAFVPKMTQNA